MTRYALPVLRRVTSALLASLAVVGLGTASGCASRGVLVADTGEHRLTAQDEDSGVSVVLTTGVWDGKPSDLPQQWTVMHVLVANLGDQPMLLAPGDLELRDDRGFLHELLDAGAVFELAEGDGSIPYGRTYHRDYDPGGPVDFEPIVAPGTVAARALPWGVLEPGTQMRGFVYFQPVEPVTNTATLTWHVRRPDHAPVVDLRFDLHVSRTRRAKG